MLPEHQRYIQSGALLLLLFIIKHIHQCKIYDRTYVFVELSNSSELTPLEICLNNKRLKSILPRDTLKKNHIRVLPVRSFSSYLIMPLYPISYRCVFT